MNGEEFAQIFIPFIFFCASSESCRLAGVIGTMAATPNIDTDYQLCVYTDSGRSNFRCIIQPFNQGLV